MIAWSIIKALDSKCFDDVIVSTDDKEIAEISKKYGAKVPFVRPKNLSDNFTGTTPVIKHAIEWLKNHERNYKYVCCLYATAPFVEVSKINDAFKKLVDYDADYSFPITTYEYPIERALKFNGENKLEMLYPKNFNKRSQDCIETYHDVGQFYWGKYSSWVKEKKIFDKYSTPVIIGRDKAQDIDTPEDWNIAERIFKKINQNL